MTVLEFKKMIDELVEKYPEYANYEIKHRDEGVWEKINSAYVYVKDHVVILRLSGVYYFSNINDDEFHEDPGIKIIQ